MISLCTTSRSQYQLRSNCFIRPWCSGCLATEMALWLSTLSTEGRMCWTARSWKGQVHRWWSSQLCPWDSEGGAWQHASEQHLGSSWIWLDNQQYRQCLDKWRWNDILQWHFNDFSDILQWLQWHAQSTTTNTPPWLCMSPILSSPLFYLVPTFHRTAQPWVEPVPWSGTWVTQ